MRFNFIRRILQNSVYETTNSSVNFSSNKHKISNSLFWKVYRGNSSCSLIDVETYILSLGSVERDDSESVDSQEKKNYYPRSRPIIDLRQNSRKTRLKENHGNGPGSKYTCTFLYMSMLAAMAIMIIIILSGYFMLYLLKDLWS